MKCDICLSSNLQEVKDYYNLYRWKFCNICDTWYCDQTEFGRVWKYVYYQERVYVLEEQDDKVLVYETLIDNIDNYCQPDMLITVPAICTLKNKKIKDIYQKLDTYLNFI